MSSGLYRHHWVNWGNIIKTINKSNEWIKLNEMCWVLFETYQMKGIWRQYLRGHREERLKKIKEWKLISKKKLRIERYERIKRSGY